MFIRNLKYKRGEITPFLSSHFAGSNAIKMVATLEETTVRERTSDGLDEKALGNGSNKTCII